MPKDFAVASAAQKPSHVACFMVMVYCYTLPSSCSSLADETFTVLVFVYPPVLHCSDAVGGCQVLAVLRARSLTSTRSVVRITPRAWVLSYSVSSNTLG